VTFLATADYTLFFQIYRDSATRYLTSGFYESVSPKQLSIPQGPRRFEFFENSCRYSQFKVHHRCRWHWWVTCRRCRWHLDLQIFEKIWNDPNVIFRGFGKEDSWKKPEAKISWHCPWNRMNKWRWSFPDSEACSEQGIAAVHHRVLAEIIRIMIIMLWTRCIDSLYWPFLTI
jgi:hypothetical protein